FSVLSSSIVCQQYVLRPVSLGPLRVLFLTRMPITGLHTLSLHDALPISGAPSPGSSPVTRCSPWITAQGCRPGNHFWTCTCFPRCGAHSCTCGARDTPH